MKKLKTLGMLLLAGMLAMTSAAVISAQTPVQETKLAKAVYGTPEEIDGKLDAGLFSQIWSDDQTDSAWKDETKLGTVQLEAKPAAAKPAAAEPEAAEPVVDEAVEETVEAPAEEVVVEAPVVEEETVEAPAAPQTFNLGIILLAFAGVSGAITAVVSNYNFYQFPRRIS